MSAFAAGFVVVGAGLAVLIAFVFPMYSYKICYALGGCQNTLDNYVDQFIGVRGHTRKIAKRDVNKSEMKDMDYVLEFLKRSIQEYGNKATVQRDERSNVMRLTPGSDHQIEKRSPMDYIEPILVMFSKAYNEFVDPELKKNFRKRRYIR